MKKCTGCNTTKPFSDFTKNAREKDGYRRYCRDCSAAYERSNYHNGNTKKAAHAAGQARRVHRNRLFICDYLSTHPCIDCGEKDFTVLEFDHIEDKEQNISTLVAGAHSIVKIEKEIRKCVVRCANCHRRKTFIQLGWFNKNDPKYDTTAEDVFKELQDLKINQPERGIKRKNSKLDDEKVREIRAILKSENCPTLVQIANLYGVSARLILNIKQNKVWKHVLDVPNSTLS